MVQVGLVEVGLLEHQRHAEHTLPEINRRLPVGPHQRDGWGPCDWSLAMVTSSSASSRNFRAATASRMGGETCITRTRIAHGEERKGSSQMTLGPAPPLAVDIKARNSLAPAGPASLAACASSPCRSGSVAAIAEVERARRGGIGRAAWNGGARPLPALRSFRAGRTASAPHRWLCVPLTASPSSLVKATNGTGRPP